MLRWPLILIAFSTSVAFSAQNLGQNATGSIEFHLSGILISTKNRSALVNGGVAREGERVDGIEILAIDEDGVRVLNGTREYTVLVGSTARLAPSPARRAHRARTAQLAGPSVRRVSSGDTLSEIAEDYAGTGASLNQVMVALFNANPEAFDGNINRLRAGSELQIPQGMELQGYAPESAMAEVLRQTQSWRGRRSQPLQVAQIPPLIGTDRVISEAVPDVSEYGPVGYGETLSEIAVQVAGDGVSMYRMMSALFDENPHAFGGTIDLLHEGAVLRIPRFEGVDPTATLAASRH